MDGGLLYGFLAVGIGCFALELLLNKGKGNSSTTRSILFLSILPGLLFLVMGALTQEAVGYGDGFSVLAMGFYMETYMLWKVVGISLVLIVFYVSAQEFVQKHRYKRKHRYKQEQENGQIQRDETVPFLPFLLTGMVVMLGAS